MGPIACPANTATTIYQTIPGWDTATNPTDGVLGKDTESRSAFEARRAASVALNSVGSLPSIRAAVLSVPNVLDAYVTENDEATNQTIGGYTLDPTSLYVAVVGGVAEDVARAIWKKKAPGCAYNGNTTVTIEDDNSGYTPPYPSYTVKFETPTPLQILFAVNLVNSALVPSDAADQVQAAIINAFSGGDGGPRAQIGSTIYASRFYSAVAALGPWAQIVSILIGSRNTPDAVIAGTSHITTTTLTVGTVSSGAVAIGQTVLNDDSTVLPGTRILSGSGTSWTVSKSQTVPNGTLKLATPSHTSVDVQIDQVPTIDAVNIVVTLS
jgi:hypothetical protein